MIVTWKRHLVASICAISLTTSACGAQDARADSTRAVPTADSTSRGPWVVDEEQQKVLDASARSAWAYVRRNYSETTGLVRALDSWDYVTIWDIGSAIAAYHSARGLGLIDDSDYRRRMDRALATLEAMPLYQNAIYNKQYSSRTARMSDRNAKLTETGFGWSAIDVGRFLTWMKIVEQNDATAAPVVQRIVKRLDLRRLVDSGYLRGSNRDLKYNNHYEYQEGRIGYEQYAAEGVALWGLRAENALTFSTNGKPVSVLGQTVLADARGDDVLTSEPFIMMGMELGWSGDWESQARGVLAAQEARFKRTKLITMVSEDAIPVPPAHFYYYLVHRNGKDFIVTEPGGKTRPSYSRWISVKAAYGWYALFPSEYTWDAVRAVQRAGATGRGWTAGVYERSRRPTPRFNLNTAAIVLEAALYAKRGCALAKATC
jgi:hypothetical protein